MNKVSKAILLLLVLALSVTTGFAKGHYSEPMTLRIIHTNDHHSHLDGSTYDLGIDGTATRLTLGGFARLATVIKAEKTPNAIVVNSGELNGTLFFSMFKGEADFRVFNSLGLDAYALGNHEFDEGDAGLAKLLALANFPTVASNVVPEEASALYQVKDKIVPYVIKNVEGQKVAIIGILKVEKTRNSSLVSDDVQLLPEIETLKSVVAEIEGMGINKIVLLSHVGYFNDITFAKEVAGIDVIVGGDTHNLLDSTGSLDELGLSATYNNQTGPFEGYSHEGYDKESLGAYPTTVTGPDGNPCHIVTAWEYAYGVGILDVQFDAQGVATLAEGNIVMPVEGPFLQKDADGNRVEVSDETKEEILAFIEKSPVLTYASVDPTVEQIIKPYRAKIETMKNQPIGSIAETMDFTRIPEPFTAGETPTGSYAAFVVSQAFRAANPRIDVAIQNAGGVRTQFLEGDFTLGDAIAALPFSNTVVMIDMTGAEIEKVLNQGAWYSLNSGSTGAFPYAAGLRYDVDTAGAEGAVILNVEVQDRDTGAWSSINPAKTYTVSTNSFTALGKDNYLEFAEVRKDETKFEDTYISYFVPLKEYIEGLPGQKLPALDVSEYCLKSVK